MLLAFARIYLICIWGQTTYSTRMKTFGYRAYTLTWADIFTADQKRHAFSLELFSPLKISHYTLSQASAAFSCVFYRGTDHKTKQREMMWKLKVVLTPAFKETWFSLVSATRSRNIENTRFYLVIYLMILKIKTRRVTVRTCPRSVTPSSAAANVCNRHRRRLSDKHWERMIRFVSL